MGLRYIILVSSSFLVDVFENDDKIIKRCIVYKVETYTIGTKVELIKIPKTNILAIVNCILKLLLHEYFKPIKYVCIETNNCKENNIITLNLSHTFTHVEFENELKFPFLELDNTKNIEKMKFDYEKIMQFAYDMAHFYTFPMYLHKIKGDLYGLHYEFSVKNYTSCVRYIDIILHDILCEPEQDIAFENPKSLKKYLHKKIDKYYTYNKFIGSCSKFFCVGNNEDEKYIDSIAYYKSEGVWELEDDDEQKRINDFCNNMFEEICKIKKQGENDRYNKHLIYFTWNDNYNFYFNR